MPAHLMNNSNFKGVISIASNFEMDPILFRQCNSCGYIFTSVMEADDHDSQHLQGQTSTPVPGHNSLCSIYSCYFQASCRDDNSAHSQYHVINKNFLTLNNKAEQILTKAMSVEDTLHDI